LFKKIELDRLDHESPIEKDRRSAVLFFPLKISQDTIFGVSDDIFFPPPSFLLPEKKGTSRVLREKKRRGKIFFTLPVYKKYFNFISASGLSNSLTLWR
jgi:hypothetical protein